MSATWCITSNCTNYFLWSKIIFYFTEGESELVSGFNIEYSSSMFAMIFMAEYMNVLMVSLLSVSIIMKMYYSMDLIMKGTIMSLMFIWTRSALARMRYYILMHILWKKILPVSLMWIFMITSIMSMN